MAERRRVYYGSENSQPERCIGLTTSHQSDRIPIDFTDILHQTYKSIRFEDLETPQLYECWDSRLEFRRIWMESH